MAFVFIFVQGSKTKESGDGKIKIRLLHILDFGTRIGGIFSSILSPLMTFHCMRNLVVVNLTVMIDRVNGEIFLSMECSKSLVRVAE